MKDISVIIPTKNRQHILPLCLQPVLEQTIPSQSYEVIVIDDGSRDETARLIKEFQRRYPQLRYLYQQSRGKSAARNLGIQQSQAPLLALLDDDCIVEADWLEEFIRLARNNQEKVVFQGRMVNYSQGNIYGETWQFAFSKFVDYALAGKQAGYIDFMGGTNVSLERSAFQLCGDYDTSLECREDEDLRMRLQKLGYRIKYEPQIIVKHYYRQNFIAFTRQHFNYGRYQYLLFRKWGKEVRYKHGGVLGKKVRFYNPTVFFELWQKYGGKAVPMFFLLCYKIILALAGLNYERLICRHR